MLVASVQKVYIDGKIREWEGGGGEAAPAEFRFLEGLQYNPPHWN